MRTPIAVFLVLLLVDVALSQDLEEKISQINTEIERLEAQQTAKSKSNEIFMLKLEVAALRDSTRKARKAEIQAVYDDITDNVAYISSFSGNIREINSTGSAILATLEQGDKVYVQDRQDSWYQVKIRNSNPIGLGSEELIRNAFDDGWVHQSIISFEEVEKIPHSTRQDVIRSRDFVQNNPDLSDQERVDILAGTIRIGMTKEMVQASIGKPSDINRTVTASMVKEQWVYGDGVYVYIENGVMTSFQD